MRLRNFLFCQILKNLSFFNDNYTNKEKEIRQHDIKISFSYEYVLCCFCYINFYGIIVCVINLENIKFNFTKISCRN